LNKKIIRILLSVIIISLTYNPFIFSQDTTTSLAYKKKPQFYRYSMFYRSDLSYQLWHQFNLVQKAKEGDPIAEHELGLRYLMGEGFTSDTTLGANWIGNAAKKNLTSAEYNYAILLNNGWGVEWNPFEAYNYFQRAALDGMPQAEYILGVTHLNDLIVKKDYLIAYQWFKKSSESGFEPASEYLKILEKKISPDLLKPKKQENKTPNNNGKIFNNNITSTTTPTGLEIIDFDLIQDSARVITDKDILNPFLSETNSNLADSLGITENNDSTINLIQSGLPYLQKTANAGNPESLTLLGRLYDKGKYFEKDKLNSTVYYVRAARLNSGIAANLLYQIFKDEKYFTEIKSLAKKGNEKAKYIWYGLYSLGFIRDIAEKDAFNLILQSANSGFLPAKVELGLSYYTGYLTKKDEEKAKDVWETAAQLGSDEALARISAKNILEEIDNIKNDIKTLLNSADMGSIFAEVTLGNLYENGIGVEKNKTKAVMYYKASAQRGDRYAFNQLKRMYDEIRPVSFRF